jgi:hypothetical protein
MTVHLRTNASGPLSARCDDTAIANATISSTPKKVTAALMSASSFARFICDPSKRLLQPGGIPAVLGSAAAKQTSMASI